MNIIGEIKDNKVSLGYSGNGNCYKNYVRFNNRSNEICYVPEYGFPEDHEDVQCPIDNPELVSFNYWDFIDIAMEYTKIDDVNHPRVLEVAGAIFALCDWQTPDQYIFAEIDED